MIQSVLPLQVLHQWYQVVCNFTPLCVWLGGGSQSPLEIYLYGNLTPSQFTLGAVIQPVNKPVSVF